MTHDARPAPLLRPAAFGRFARDEAGSAIVLGLFLIVAMLIAASVGIDTMRYETERTKVQNIADSAVLAAAALDKRQRLADGSLPEEAYDPEDVVADYFARAGVPRSAVDIDVDPVAGGKQVSATIDVKIPTFFLKLVGVTELKGPAFGQAVETVNDIEVALVLDNSGSMNSNNRLNLLKDAAKQFVEDVVRDDTGQGSVAVSIVPFATQVNAGADLASYFNLSGEHDLSHCVTFGSSDFLTSSLSLTDPLTQTAHFDRDGNREDPSMMDMVCNGDEIRAITPWSSDRDALRDRIDAMVAGGWTSIEVGTKWGLALLDPAARPILTDMIANGEADATLTGMPFDYDRESSKKYLIVMSDGENTQQSDIKDPYRAGLSPIYMDPGFNSRFSYYDSDRNEYFWTRDNQWHDAPDGGAGAVQLTWPDVWAEMSVKWYANRIARRVFGGSWQSHYNDVVYSVPTSVKNARTAQICAEARGAQITVFTIGVDTYGQGDATLLDCASGEPFFYDVTADEMDEAFSSIARQINQLRLTQ